MPGRWAPAAAVVAAVVAVLAAPRAAAADDFASSSPGALSTSHADLDDADHCDSCHTGGRALSNDRCLGCHEHADLAARIAGNRGFHASAQVRGKDCEACHLEHKGRGYDVMGWKSQKGGMAKFDHDLTGWKLEGKHATTDCQDCHPDKDGEGLRTFLGQDKLCGSCHKKDQPHGFERREMLACERCHGQSVWQPAKSTMDFDHDKKSDAAMPLAGSHADVACAKCHPKSRFNLKPADPASCKNCHKDPHGGTLYDTIACAKCHSPTYRALDKFKFDHDQETRFDLTGKHKKIDCLDCHTTKLGEKKPDRACETCHAKDSKHKDRFSAFGDPPACGVCHPSSRWTPDVFNHAKRTKFKLTGKHADVDCRACHRGKTASEFERFDAKKVGCMGCHQHATVHDGQWKDSQCLDCHKGAGEVGLTKKSVDTYHGPRSTFPLVKAHKTVKCAQCHPKDSYKDTPTECGARCHQDSLHQGSLGTECSRCHSPGRWDAVRFDHADDTDWPLEGLHRTVPDCQECHPARRYAGTPRTCSAEGCHAQDDAHRGRLGKACDRCHRVTGDNVFNHNRMSRYQLDGAHLTVRCADCHPSKTFKPRPTDCAGCHPEPDVHRGEFGTACEQCHSTTTFADIRPLHDVGGFSLAGAHDHLPCDRCHRDNRPMQGTGNLCLNCHRQDDVHGNSLSPRCGECHTQWSFAPARFDHTTVGCNLTGIHRATACADCHRDGNYGAVVPTCVGCHADDAARKAGDGIHDAQVTCANCHNPDAWLPADTTGGARFGRESVCR